MKIRNTWNHHLDIHPAPKFSSPSSPLSSHQPPHLLPFHQHSSRTLTRSSRCSRSPHQRWPPVARCESPWNAEWKKLGARRFDGENATIIHEKTQLVRKYQVNTIHRRHGSYQFQCTCLQICFSLLISLELGDLQRTCCFNSSRMARLDWKTPVPFVWALPTAIILICWISSGY